MDVDLAGSDRAHEVLLGGRSAAVQEQPGGFRDHGHGRGERGSVGLDQPYALGVIPRTAISGGKPDVRVDQEHDGNSLGAGGGLFAQNLGVGGSPLGVTGIHAADEPVQPGRQSVVSEELRDQRSDGRSPGCRSGGQGGGEIIWQLDRCHGLECRTGQ